MKYEKRADITITLTLNEREAAWLHAVMQNPLHGESPARESEENKVMRQMFFTATYSR